MSAMRYTYVVFKKRAADTEWTRVNWYCTPKDARTALRLVQMYNPEMHTKIERELYSESSRYF